MDNLYRAWTTVRANVLASGSDEFKAEVQSISESPLPYLRRIQARLQRRKFQFAAQKGVLKKRRGKSPRPIVVSPIENRIVQRALLNVLQSLNPRLVTGLGEIPSILRTPTSVGGVPERGVPEAVALIRDAISKGATHYLRSDIQGFFQKIPRTAVVELVRAQTSDEAFAALFGAAMEVELANPDEVRDFLHLFPTDDIGVPQGSSLSAFAGNVVLAAFDQAMNGRGIVTIRYIDDFVILGPSGRSVRSAFKAAQALLKELGMTAYGPDEDSSKSSEGEVQEGFEFLGCAIKGTSVGPSRAARRSLLDIVTKTFRDGLSNINAMIESKAARRAEEAFAQTLSGVDRKVRGWSDAFSFADNRISFRDIDRKIDDMMSEFVARAYRAMKPIDSDGKRRAMGVALLQDSPFRAIPAPTVLSRNQDRREANS